MEAAPLELRDFSKGVIRKASVNAALVPPNSVSHSINFNYDTIIGSAVVRPGTTLVGAQVAANKTPLGLFEFVTGGQAKNYLLAVFSGASTASVYYFDSANWNTSGLTTLSNTAKCRFDMLNGYAYLTNGTDALKYSNDGNTWTSMTFTGTTPVTIKPTLIIQAKNRLIVAGDTSASRSRIYFSSIVDPTTTPGVTFNTDNAVGDFVDVNPDDGDDITAFGYTSGLVLVFKRYQFYRLDAINKTVDLNSVFPYGAASQEGVVNCQGQVYFFTGRDIRRTNGGFPDQLSRLGVQDFIDAISQANWSTVAAGTDGNNVFFSIGNVTVPATGGDAKTYNNVVLKFSVRDESWSVHSYAQQPRFYCEYTDTTNGRKMREADTGGNVQSVDVGTTDNTAAINFDLQTQELEFGVRSHKKQLSQKIAVYTKFMQGATASVKLDDGDFEPIQDTLEKRVNILASLKHTIARVFTFRLTGTSTQQAPRFEGISFEQITDLGMTYES